jgi:hypothetical protein
MKTKEEVKALILEKARAVMRRKHMSLATERSYCGWIGRFYDFCLHLSKEMVAEENQPHNRAPQRGFFVLVRLFHAGL